MAFNWKFLVPLSIVNVILISLALKIMQELGWAPRDLMGASFGEMLPTTVILLVINGIMILYLLGMMRKRGREARRESQIAQAALAQAAAD